MNAVEKAKPSAAPAGAQSQPLLRITPAVVMISSGDRLDLDAANAMAPAKTAV